MRIADREGLEALSMRRLGRELGVEAMSLYRYVPSKEALLDGLVELVVLEIEVPPPEQAEWADALRLVCGSYRRAAHAHPNVFPLVTMRPLNTPDALRRLDAALEILRRAGFDEETTIAAFRATAGYTRGFALEEVTGRALGAPRRDGRVDPRALPADQFPRIAELAPRLVDRDPDAEFELGLELIIAGLEARLRRAGA